MEMVETQTRTQPLWGPLQQSPLFEICEVGEDYGAVEMPNGFAKFASTLNAARQLTRNRLLALLSTQFFAASSPAFSASS